MSLYSTDAIQGIGSWYDYLGAYDLTAGTDLMLTLTRHILESDAYQWQGLAFPTGSDVNVMAQSTFSGTVVMPPYSYVVALTGYSGSPFAVRIFDKGAQTDLYYRQFAFHRTVISDMQLSVIDPTGLFFEQNAPFGPYLFRDPLIVLPPGVLQIQVTNTDLNPPTPTIPIQMLFAIAVPKNSISFQNRNIAYPSDPTGVLSQQNPAGVQQTAASGVTSLSTLNTLFGG